MKRNNGEDMQRQQRGQPDHEFPVQRFVADCPHHPIHRARAARRGEEQQRFSGTRRRPFTAFRLSQTVRSVRGKRKEHKIDEREKMIRAHAS